MPLWRGAKKGSADVEKLVAKYPKPWMVNNIVLGKWMPMFLVQKLLSKLTLDGRWVLVSFGVYIDGFWITIFCFGIDIEC